MAEQAKKPSLPPNQTYIFCRLVPSDHRFATKLCTPVLDVSILGSHSCSRIIQTSSNLPNLEWEGKCMVLPGRRLYLRFGGGFRLFREPLVVAVTLCHTQRLFLLSLSVSSPRLLPALCQCFDFCQLWPGPFSYLLSLQLCSA